MSSYLLSAGGRWLTSLQAKMKLNTANSTIHGEMWARQTPRLLHRDLVCSVNAWMDSRRAEHRLMYLVSPSPHGKSSRCRKAYETTSKSQGAASENGFTIALSFLERKKGNDCLLCFRTLTHPVSSQQHLSLISTQLVNT